MYKYLNIFFLIILMPTIFIGSEKKQEQILQKRFSRKFDKHGLSEYDNITSISERLVSQSRTPIQVHAAIFMSCKSYINYLAGKDSSISTKAMADFKSKEDLIYKIVDEFFIEMEREKEFGKFYFEVSKIQEKSKK